MSILPDPSLDLSISSDDLSSSCHLRTLVQDNALPVFEFAAEMAAFWERQVADVPPATSASFKLSHDANWKTTSGICFGLSASAKCTLDLVSKGAVFQYTPDVQSSKQADLPEQEYRGFVYLRVSLDLEISGSLGGAGKVGPVGISGNAKGCEQASLVFCHRVPDNMPLGEAVKATLGSLVFPFEPRCALDLFANDLAQVNFHASLNCSFTLDYGITGVAFAAPSVGAVLESVTRGYAQLNLPQGTVKIGASASVGYGHEDDFTAIVQKPGSGEEAQLYLMRSHRDALAEKIGLYAKVAINDNIGLQCDGDQVRQGVNSITGGFGGALVASKIDDLNQKLYGRLNDWIGNIACKGAAIGLEWDQSKSACLLYKYTVPLANADLTTRSWTELCQGDLCAAVAAGGLKPDPGSGVSHTLSRTFILGLHFFNFFSASQKSEYFNKSRIFITDAGAIRFVYDIGCEQDDVIAKVLRKTRIHFVATADKASAGEISKADVVLQFELSASGDRHEVQRISAVAGYLGSDPQAGSARDDIQHFAHQAGAGSMTFVCALKPSAYGKLICSPYSGKKPLMDQVTDGRNWQAFHDAAVGLLGLGFARDLTYADWQNFNMQCTGAKIADRRNDGNYAGLPPDFWKKAGAAEQLKYFCLNSADFMNLCDDLHGLAETVEKAHIPEDSDQLLGDLKAIVERDLSTDYAKPVLAALLELCAPQQIVYTRTGADKTLTCTLTLS